MLPDAQAQLASLKVVLAVTHCTCACTARMMGSPVQYLASHQCDAES